MSPLKYSPMTCTYRIGEKATCQTDATTGPYCDHHATAQCVSCHGQATHNCQHQEKHTCGCPLCDGCQHVPVKGMNGQFYQHARVGEEMVIPHYGVKPK